MIETLNMADFDIILVNSSAGKDSQAMLTYVYNCCEALNIVDRMVVVHCDLGRVEWAGTRELAEEQAKYYDLRFEVVSRKQDLLDQVEQRGMWPGPTTRYCTSDHKRDQVSKVITMLIKERYTGTQLKVLNCIGLRKGESAARSKKEPFTFDKRASNGKRAVYTWLPIHDLNVKNVWDVIKESGVRHHPVYDHGMPRLSCCFCILASREAHLLAGKLNPELLKEFVRVEKKTGHTFTMAHSLEDVQRDLEAGVEPGPVPTWEA